MPPHPDGALRQVPVSEIVPGDIVRIEAGDRVPADGQLVTGQGVMADEAILTGESLPVDKDIRSELFSGTLIVRTWHDLDRDAVVLEVTDDGPGVPEDVQPKIFDPFFTTKEVGKGTGLGLAITYGIVHEHGGTIHAANAPNGGATFTIDLPAAPEGLV